MKKTMIKLLKKLSSKKYHNVLIKKIKELLKNPLGSLLILSFIKEMIKILLLIFAIFLKILLFMMIKI